MFSSAAYRALVPVSLNVSFTSLTARAADRIEGKLFATQSVSYAENGMVAAANPLAAQA